MIGFIKGRVDTIGSNYAFVETQGVGYRIYMNTSDLGRMVLDDKVKGSIRTLPSGKMP